MVTVAADVVEAGIERILHAVRPERVLVQAVGPGGQERVAEEHRPGLELADALIRRPEDGASVHLHFIGGVANRRRDGHLGFVRSVREAHDRDAVFREDGGFIVLGG